MNYPTLSWVRQQLRNNLHSRVRYPILDAYIVGSVAKGEATEISDLDIAVIIPEADRVTAVRRSERYHAKFSSNAQKPHWDGRVVDIQFFYPGSPELDGYSKIQISSY